MPKIWKQLNLDNVVKKQHFDNNPLTKAVDYCKMVGQIEKELYD